MITASATSSSTTAALIATVVVVVLLQPAMAASPVARHVHVSTAQNTDVVVTLRPYDADGDSMTVTITALPAVGTLYNVSSNFITYGYTPAKDTAIAAAPFVLSTAAAYRLVYSAPTAFAATSFTYTANDGGTTSSAGTVFVTPATNVTVDEQFHTDYAQWQVVTAQTTNATWSGTSVGSLNHFVYVGEVDLVLNANNDDRWYFSAPSKFLGNQAMLYGGTLSFWFGSFEGTFSAPYLRDNPQTFVMIECSTCAAGAGISIAQRSVSYTGGITQFSFTLNEAASSGWLKDPKDTRVTEWSAPTQCEVVQVLSAISGIRIYGDLTTLHEAIGIDAVTFKVSATADIPVACYT